MSAENTQPDSPGSMFRLLAELRAIIWEMVIFDLHSRVCSLAPLETLDRGHHPNLTIPGNGPDGLFVYDWPVLRDVCRESRQEAIYHSAALGWQFSGQEPPKRPYAPDVDVLYLGPYGFFDFLKESSQLQSLGYPNRPIPMAAVQVRKARHIAIPHSLQICAKFQFEMLLQGCPRIDKVSLIIGNVGMEDNINLEYHNFIPVDELAKRPCKLGEVPNLEPITVEVSKASILAYTRRHVTKRAYFNAKEASVEFATAADAVARDLRCRSLPPPQPAMLLQLSKVTKEGQQWEEMRDLSSWPEPRT